MLVLILFAFLGGIVTILSPCILPILPIVLGSGTTGGKSKPLGIIAGFILSFTFFTLFLSSLVRLTNLSADFLRTLAAAVILSFGLILVIPRLNAWWDIFSSRLANKAQVKTQTKNGFWSGLVIGISLGLIWTPCVGPILAAMISLAITGSVSASAIPVVLAYAVGTAIPLFLILVGLKKIIPTWPWLQKAFGVLMIVTALAIYLNLDRQFQTWVLDRFPNYGTNLTKIEDNNLVKQQLEQMGEKAAEKDLAPEIDGGTRWLNSQPLTMAGLKGKVVLIDFWTYSCINCIRTLPYLTAWDTKYREKGLVIIGVHSPEFEFEKNPDNVLKAMADFGINYPVVQDNDFVIWRAYNNRYWPAKYLIDKNGVIRYTHFGEGAYDKTERKIQELLGETADLVSLQEYQSQTRTPETYLGSLRAIPNNPIYSLSGNWLTTPEYIRGQQGSSLTLTFDAKEINLVVRPADTGANLELTLDGKPLPTVTVTGDKLYNLIKLETAGRHELMIILTGPLELFAFTFG